MQSINVRKLLKSPEIKVLFSDLYGEDDRIFKININRYLRNVKKFENIFFTSPDYLFSSPSRTEICGNHTDHNGGRVLAASVSPDSIASVAEVNDNTITIYSESYPDPFIVFLDNLYPVEKEKGTTTAIMRGTVARFKELGYDIGGFNAYISSNVLIGSGLSSSASIEMLIGKIINYLFNSDKISKKEMALIGQYAENIYFNKPCGLMDQLTIAVGGIISIDFKDSENPVVHQVGFEIDNEHYCLLLVNTGENHADLIEDYASIPKEMKMVARFFNGNVCRGISFQDIVSNLQSLRSNIGDRAILRALHFIEDDQRVMMQVSALEKNDFNTFLNLVNESGNSSCKWLQNCHTTKNHTEQSLTLALALTEIYIKKTGIAGACRVHGGGFAGTIQVFIHKELVDDYIVLIESAFSKNCVNKLKFRPMGAVCINSIVK